jgi:hypothetical protein
MHKTLKLFRIEFSSAWSDVVFAFHAMTKAKATRHFAGSGG